MVFSAGSHVVEGVNFMEFWDWSNSLNNGKSNVFSKEVHFLLLGSSDDVSNVLVDLINMSKGVGENFLSKLCWVLEDGRPGLDSVNIWAHSGAVLEVGVDGGNHSSHDGNTGNDVSDVLLLEVSEGLIEGSRDDVSILEAGLDLGEIVVLDETIKKASNKFSDLVFAKTLNFSLISSNFFNFWDWSN